LRSKEQHLKYIDKHGALVIRSPFLPIPEPQT